MVARKGAKPFILIPQDFFNRQQQQHQQSNNPNHQLYFANTDTNLTTEDQQSNTPQTYQEEPAVNQQDPAEPIEAVSLKNRILEEVIGLGLKQTPRNNKAWESVENITDTILANQRVGVEFSTLGLTIDGQELPGVKASQFLYDLQRLTKKVPLKSYALALRALNISTDLINNRQVLSLLIRPPHKEISTTKAPPTNAKRKNNSRDPQTKYAKGTPKLRGAGYDSAAPTKVQKHRKQRHSKWITF